MTTPYYADDWLTVFQGDCREVLATLPAESVHCVVTSPPYFGLRDYGTATWEGGDADCEHLGAVVRSGAPGSEKQASKRGSTNVYSGDCACGATRIDSQLGLEPTPSEYVANLVAVFREVRRVLRSDGTVWLNLGDSYAANGVSGLAVKGDTSTLVGTANAAHTAQRKTVPFGLKPKDLVGIPWRVAFALQADGWYLRSDIIWAKPNPMPESVTDRPTKSHEYLFLLSKSPRYFFDADAVREPHIRIWDENNGGSISTGRMVAAGGAMGDMGTHPKGYPLPNPAGRNIRSVWQIATQPFKGAHFATFPRKLVEPCIKAGTSERGVCPECGAPWERDTLHIAGDAEAADRPKRTAGMESRTSTLSLSGNGSREWAERGGKRETTGWRPTCDHDAAPVPATVLDPFAGSGTTAVVAQSLNRRAVLIDLNGDYIVQAMGRNRDIPLGLVE